jgi:hypothetical protein
VLLPILLAVAPVPGLADAGAPAVPVAGALDPGPRGGAPGAGGPLAELTQAELDQFMAAQQTFLQVNSVHGVVAGETGEGLGPRFNANGCAACHAQPAVGGTSPAVNPLPAIATLDGAQNVVPWFIAPNGPIREARFQRNPDGTPDGGVHDLFTIAGRIDATGCTSVQLQQLDFGPPGNGLTGQGGSANVVFRIPTPLFGAGLIEEIPDSAILANLSAYGPEKRAQGVTNAVFQTEGDETPVCLLNDLPEDGPEECSAMLPRSRRGPPTAQRCGASLRTSTRISSSTGWARGSPTGSAREPRAAPSSGPLRSGGSGSGCSSCTTGGPPTSSRPSTPTRARGARRTR